MDYELRPITKDDAAAWAECAGTAFGIHFPDELVLRDIEAVGAERTIAALDGSLIVGTTSSFGSELTLPGGGLVSAAAVYAVTVLPSHRRRGILTAMMRRQLPERYEAGDVLAILTASEGGIYGRFGYGVATHKCRYEIDKRVARLARPAGELATGSIRLVGAAEAEESISPLWDVARRRQTGEIAVPDNYWYEHFHELEMRGADAKHLFFAAYEEAGKIEGWVEYEIRDEPPRRENYVEIHLLVATTPAAYAALFEFVLSIDLTWSVRMSHRPVDEPLRQMLQDRRQLFMTRYSDDLWIRPLDLAAALRARRYAPLPGRLSLEVSDEICGWNQGVYALETDGSGEVAVQGPASGAGGADITLDASAIGSVLLGGGRFSSLVRAGLAFENTPGAAWRADALFRAETEPFSTLGF